MATGRPREFDENEVLSRAMDLFWMHGFGGIGVAELVSAMGISRQSLYGAFGSKRNLFIRVIEHYRATQLSGALELLSRDGSPLQNVKDVVAFFEKLASAADCRGCLVANALVEMGPHDPEVADLLDETLALLRKGLRDALGQASETGELAPGKDPDQLAHALTNALIGLAVTGRLPGGQAVIPAVYSGTLSMLD